MGKGFNVRMCGCANMQMCGCANEDAQLTLSTKVKFPQLPGVISSRKLFRVFISRKFISIFVQLFCYPPE